MSVPHVMRTMVGSANLNLKEIYIYFKHNFVHDKLFDDLCHYSSSILHRVLVHYSTSLCVRLKLELY